MSPSLFFLSWRYIPVLKKIHNISQHERLCEAARGSSSCDLYCLGSLRGSSFFFLHWLYFRCYCFSIIAVFFSVYVCCHALVTAQIHLCLLALAAPHFSVCLHCVSSSPSAVPGSFLWSLQSSPFHNVLYTILALYIVHCSHHPFSSPTSLCMLLKPLRWDGACTASAT